jgi:hypothetical protein
MVVDTTRLEVLTDDLNITAPPRTLSDVYALPMDNVAADDSFLLLRPFKNLPSSFALATRTAVYCFNVRDLRVGSSAPFLKLSLSQLLPRPSQPSDDAIVDIGFDTKAPPLHDRLQIVTRGHVIGVLVNESESTPLYRPQLGTEFRQLSLSRDGDYMALRRDGSWDIFSV